MNALVTFKAWWAALAARERRMLGLAAAVVSAALVWWLLLGAFLAAILLAAAMPEPGTVRPGALAALYQQGQIDISPGNFNAIQILKSRGVPVEFVAPKEGAIAFKTTIHIVKNSPNKELAFKLIEASLSPEVQAKLMESPYLIVPTNTKVKMAGEIAKVLRDGMQATVAVRVGTTTPELVHTLDAAGITAKFVQDNHSMSAQGTLRGLHYQLQHTQGKLVRVTTIQSLLK